MLYGCVFVRFVAALLLEPKRALKEIRWNMNFANPLHDYFELALIDKFNGRQGNFHRM